MPCMYTRGVRTLPHPEPNTLHSPAADTLEEAYFCEQQWPCLGRSHGPWRVHVHAGARGHKSTLASGTGRNPDHDPPLTRLLLTPALAMPGIDPISGHPGHTRCSSPLNPSYTSTSLTQGPVVQKHVRTRAEYTARESNTVKLGHRPRRPMACHRLTLLG